MSQGSDRRRWKAPVLVVLVFYVIGMIVYGSSPRKVEAPVSANGWPTTTGIELELESNARQHDVFSLEMMTNEYIEKSNHFTIKPKDIEFLPDRRSPCWKRGRKVRCLPALYIAGFPKCATTTLWKLVTKHKQVATSCTKEPNFWALYRFKPWRQSFDQYLDCFKSVTTDKDKITVDASPLNIVNNLLMKEQDDWPLQMATPLSAGTEEALLDNQILPMYLIHQYTPNAKFIIALREPVGRTYSYYNYLRRWYPTIGGALGRYIKNHTSPRDFHKRVVDKLALFRECLARADLRTCAHEKQTHGIVNQVELAFYGVYIHEVLRVIPRENVLFINQDDLSANPRRVMERVFNFLELDHDESALKKIEKAERENTALVKPRPMFDVTRRLLEEAYAPFNRQLARLVNDTALLYGYS